MQLLHTQLVQISVEFGVERPVCQRIFEVGELIVYMGRPLQNLSFMHLQHLVLESLSSHPINKKTDDNSGNTGDDQD
jgi:hypothetical protein